MIDPGDVARQEDVVRRLRELHATAGDEDRPRAALYLGLAITDLIPRLPDGDARRGALAGEGLSRLDESADASPAVTAARKLLTRLLAANHGPESFQFAGGDLGWDMDWEALRGPAEAARNLAATLPLIASMLPPQAPLRQALDDIADVIRAIDQGQWSPQQDEVLRSAIRQVEQGGLGAGLGMTLRLVAMVIRVHRCRLAEQEGKHPEWPSLAEFDALITDMESADDLAAAFSGPFEAMAGLHHLYIACLVMMRLHVDVHRPDVRRDKAWRDGILGQLDLANDHLRQAPSAYAGPVQHMRGNLAKAFAALSQANLPDTAPSAPHPRPTPPPAPGPGRPAGAPAPPTPAPPTPAPTPADEAPSADPAGAALDGVVIGNTATPSWTLDQSFGQIAAPEVLAGFRMLAELSGGSAMTPMSHLGGVLQSIFARRWTPEAEQELTALRQEAERLDGEPGSPLSNRAVVAAMLAMAQAGQWHLLSVSPRPAERPSVSQVTGVIAQVERALDLLSTAAAESPSVPTFTELQGLLHAQAASLLTDIGRPGGDNPNAGLIEQAREHMAHVPHELFEQMPPVVGDIFALRQIVADGTRPEAAVTRRLAERFGEAMEASGADLTAAHDAVDEARRRHDPAAIATAISELNTAGIALPAGSPRRAHMLVLLAEMQTLQALHTSYPLALADAAGTAIEAARAARTPDDRQSGAQRLTAVFSLMTASGQRDGPFEQAEKLLRAALADAGPGEWSLRVTAMAGIGAAMAMRAAATDDQDLRQAAGQLIADAERLLPEATSAGDWYDVARTLYTWTAMHGLSGPDAELVPVALRLIDKLEGVLADRQSTAAAGDGSSTAGDEAMARELEMLREHRTRLLAVAGQPPGQAAARGPIPEPEEAQRLARRRLERSAASCGRTGPGGLSRRPLAAAGRPDPASLREAMADLHTALAGVLGDTDLRRQIDTALGLCAAELYWSHPAAQTLETLQDAVVHLNRALASGDHALPTTGRADLLDVLARCWHRAALRPDLQEEQRVSARTEAERAARAAVRELARCVLLAEDTGQALRVAAQANEIVARSVGWCLADGRDRAAVEMAEAGRGLVLAGVVLAGRVEEVLRGAGRPDVAEAWRQGGEAGRAEALNALWDTSASTTLLAAPTADEVSITLAATHLNAVVYLVPPAPAGDGDPGDDVSPAGQFGHAVLVRPLLSKIEVLPLHGLVTGDSEPLDEYLAALDNALASSGPAAENDEGFRGGPRGQEWASALMKLGRWAYDRIMGPLIEHLDGWTLDHRPHLALIPLGDLAAIPYTAAWTGTDEPTGSRRYAIDDLVLSYAPSARFLGEVSRRPRQPLTERVVLVSDLTGEFPMARRAATALARYQYPGAEVYGLKTAPHGPGHDRRPARCAAGTGPARGIAVPAVHARDDRADPPAAEPRRVATAHSHPGAGPQPAGGRAGRPDHHQRVPH